jgi:hypothetical protein
MCKFISLNDEAAAREFTKESMRKDTINRLLSQRENDTKAFIESTLDPKLQANLDAYMQSLKNKNK